MKLLLPLTLLVMSLGVGISAVALALAAVFTGSRRSLLAGLAALLLSTPVVVITFQIVDRFTP